MKKHWTEMLVFSHESKGYLMFNFLITILCLVSSYYYGSIAGFRYSLKSTDDLDHLLMQIIIEGIFLIHFILQFFLDFVEEGKNYPVRDLAKIFKRYINSQVFFLDFLTIIPLQLLDLKNNRHYLFFGIKMLRIVKGLHVFDVNKIMRWVKMKSQQKI